MSAETSAALIRRLAERGQPLAPRRRILIEADGTGSDAEVRVTVEGCDLAAAVGLLDLAKMELYTHGSSDTQEAAP
jgi:hypothetical protein